MIITKDIVGELSVLAGDKNSDEIYILTDTNTREQCLPALFNCEKLRNSHIITIPAGDHNKNVESLCQIWQYLSKNGATRKSIMINVGGGMITDIGGFAAATFKRGIEYINVSTTLLGAVDAATGGKTGINFLGYKNEIGAFAPAKAVLTDVDFFRTLNNENIRSGFAEMIKHALISSKSDYTQMLRFDLNNIDYDALQILLKRNIEIKNAIVATDPQEEGLRKALNFGHTFAHAIESYSYRIRKPLLHGYAVAWGLLCELYLSRIKFNFPKDEFLKVKQFVKENYGRYDCGCADYEELLELMTHDKKNDSREINFTLLANIGEIKINQTATRAEIVECFENLY